MLSTHGYTKSSAKHHSSIQQFKTQGGMEEQVVADSNEQVVADPNERVVENSEEQVVANPEERERDRPRYLQALPFYGRTLLR